MRIARQSLPALPGELALPGFDDPADEVELGLAPAAAAMQPVLDEAFPQQLPRLGPRKVEIARAQRRRPCTFCNGQTSASVIAPAGPPPNPRCRSSTRRVAPSRCASSRSSSIRRRSPCPPDQSACHARASTADGKAGAADCQSRSIRSGQTCCKVAEPLASHVDLGAKATACSRTAPRRRPRARPRRPSADRSRAGAPVPAASGPAARGGRA